MASTKAILLSFFSLCLLLSRHGSLAQGPPGQPGQDVPSQQGQGQCRIERLNALEPSRRDVSEGGETEHWDENDEQLQCAGVAVRRHTIQPNGLLVPTFSNAPSLVYIIQGQGISGQLVPGCSETYHSIRSQSEEGEGRRAPRFRDRHQKIHRFRSGDVIALSPGIAHWCYNDGEAPIVAVVVTATRNYANQLDGRLREFMLAGRQQSGQQQRPYEREGTREESYGKSILSGFEAESLAEVLGVSSELVRRMQSETDERGAIVYVKDGLRVLQPGWTEEEEQRQQQEGEREGERLNGLEESMCNYKIRENIGRPRRADIYNPRAGRITSLNNAKLPILASIKMNAERGVLYRNAFHLPLWNVNAHSILYVTGGRGQLQIVGDQGKTVFNGELQRGQLIVIPQNFVVVKQARTEGFEWVTIKTHDDPIVNHIAGERSVLEGLPVDVIANSFGISREEARRVKNNRLGEHALVASAFRQSAYASM